RSSSACRAESAFESAIARPKMTTSHTVRITPPTAAAVRRSAPGPVPNHRRTRLRRAVWGASDDGDDAKADMLGRAGDADPWRVAIPGSVAGRSYGVKPARAAQPRRFERESGRHEGLRQALDCPSNRTDDRFVDPSSERVSRCGCTNHGGARRRWNGCWRI